MRCLNRTHVSTGSNHSVPTYKDLPTRLIAWHQTQAKDEYYYVELVTAARHGHTAHGSDKRTMDEHPYAVPRQQCFGLVKVKPCQLGQLQICHGVVDRAAGCQCANQGACCVLALALECVCVRLCIVRCAIWAPCQHLQQAPGLSVQSGWQ